MTNFFDRASLIGLCIEDCGEPDGRRAGDTAAVGGFPDRPGIVGDENDQRDAADLADLLRMGRLPEAWIAPPATRELRGWVRHRAKLVGLRSSLKCQVHGVLANAGVWVPMTDLFGLAGQQLLAELQAGFRLPLESRSRLDSALRVITALEFEIDRQAGQRPPARRPRLPRDPTDPRHRAGAGRGVRGRDRRHLPLPAARAARQLGGG